MRSASQSYKKKRGRSSYASCSKTEQEKAVEDVKACAKNIIAKLDKPFCTRMDLIINGCTDTRLRKCFNATYIRLVKDVEIVVMSNVFKQTGKSDLFNECEVAKEFFDSKRSVYRPSATCTPEQVQASEEHRQECVQQNSDALQRRINRKIHGALPYSDSEAQEMICEFIEKAVVDCNNVFRKCYNDDEMKKMKKTQYETVLKFLKNDQKDIGGLQGIDLEKCSENPGISEVIRGSS